MLFNMVVGLPGSGKTSWAQRRQMVDSILIDDPKDLQKDVIERVLYTKQHASYHAEIFVVDPWFCLENVRKVAEDALRKWFPTSSIQWIFFENNLETCMANLERRKTEGDTRHIGKQIDFFHQNYHIPDGQRVRKCYTPNNFKIGDKIISNLGIKGTIVGYYSDAVIQVIFEGSAFDNPEFVDSSELTFIEDPNEVLKKIL